MMRTPRKIDKVPFKTKNAFNSTMMASFLQVKLEQKRTNKPRKICLLLQCLTNSQKSEENIKMTFCDIHINIIYTPFPIATRHTLQ